MLGATLALLVTTAAASNEAGQRFLEENKRRDGVVVLPSGLQYKVLRSGDGEHHPTVDSPCECHYEGRTAQQWPEGETFDSSYKRGSPTSFAPNRVIKGWTEAMQLMVEGARHPLQRATRAQTARRAPPPPPPIHYVWTSGDKWEMYIPSELGYGERGSPPKIGAGDVLVFTMEILKIKGDKVRAVCSVARDHPGVMVDPRHMRSRVL